ncbi:EAL domain-containing protein [Roseomonas sp. KE2513]|uniref:putative bifunctional diguanylate cyclase/phosphodiesterase n=1 Tax=Roseomonas sp. KE2513 TaxID=2479202 RepID=UPI0018DF9E5A|nr:EAL domain-containing protein [Roseomonas sp. KE2513]MBI0535337.1 EAL domain-containing protein [Roseomonas sp. KE2513]
MIQILACLTGQHDHGIVLGAALLCVVAALACTLSVRGAGRLRPVLSALLIAIGAWSTHFVALLAYDPGIPMGYDLSLTLLSAALALVGALAGFAVWFAGQARPLHRAAGGALLGAGLAGMHDLGMLAVRVPGHLVVAPGHLLASLAVATLLGAAALHVLRLNAVLPRALAAAALLTATVLSLHFTAMGGVTAWPDPAVPVPRSALPRDGLLILIVTLTAVTISAILIVLAVEARIGLAAQAAEAGRLRGLADAAFDALALLDAEGRVVDASSQLAALTGTAREALIGRPFATLLEEGATETGPARLVGGLPVELRRRTIETASGARIVVALRDLRERLDSQSRLERLAHHDTLTGLANRALLRRRIEEEIARTARGAARFAVLCLDLDRFKPVNDLYGHAAGDQLLQQVAGRLTASLRGSDLCARIGGDEFVVLQTMTDAAEPAQALTQRLVSALAEPFHLTIAEVTVSASIGIALFPDDATTPEELLRVADLALYRVKENGRSGFAFFHVAMDQEIRHRHALERDLRQAVANGEMSLAWQPQAAADTGEVTGFEALLRWHNPARGSVSPATFIPLAEASGAILPIGAWVLQTALREAASWTRPLRVAVNVSALQIQQGDFPDLLRTLLEETRLDPRRLELEVTESLLIADTDRALATLRELKSIGVQLSLDDFGTGYSSLSMLRNFPFDRVKMDRSFVSALTDDNSAAAVVQGILGLSRGIGLPVVAEGVETEAQMSVLQAARCDEVQGYLVGKPRSIGDYQALVHPGREIVAA